MLTDFSIGSAVVGGIVGAVCMVISANKIEAVKYNRKNKSYLSNLYLELQDISEECSNELDCLYDIYAKAIHQDSSDTPGLIKKIDLPEYLLNLTLKEFIKTNLFILKINQRKSLKKIISLIDKSNIYSSRLMNDCKEGNISQIIYNSRYLIVLHAVIYQLSLNMAIQKDRYIIPSKSTNQLLRTTLEIKRMDLSTAACIRYVNYLGTIN
ncbi:hypothetical protein [Celerinatantimonas sp. MCCC 1A17872]|uniref:hypothetical protein n=1 Tax=Celerinatantimonas sp. MCCC 1A17872 TaxID=3177514 RepID=UPI0038C5458F